MKHPLSSFDRTTLFHTVRNYFFSTGQFCFPVHLDESPVEDLDYALAEKLIKIFHEMAAAENRKVRPQYQPRAGVWAMVQHEFHGPAYQLLRSRDVQGFAGYMRNAFRTKLCYGIGDYEETFRAFSLAAHEESELAVKLVDRLVSLAIALDILPEEVSEQGRYGENMKIPAAEIVQKIERRLNAKISRPKVMGTFGYLINGEVFDTRVAEDVYCAFQLMNLSKGAVGEIGGGIGGVAMQLIRQGCKKVYIFDLPIISLIQGWYLTKIFGSDMVSMFGERDNRPIVLRPYWEFKQRRHKFEIAFNRDSIPEMPPDVARLYMKQIAKRGIPLLSINQESENQSGQPGLLQGRVTNYARESFRRDYRAPYWIRKGYVEELYRPKGWKFWPLK